MEFAKLHGLGNDFLIARVGEHTGTSTSLGSLSKSICRRHRGVGADGIVYYEPTVGDKEAEFSALIFNADGSKAEMSGNGVRCLAAFLHHSGEHKAQIVRIRTVSGIKVFTLKAREGNTYTFESSMGQPIVDPLRVPSHLAPGPAPILDFPLIVGQETIRVTVTSMGNPHCSTFWPDIAQAPFETLGPLLENHSSFPNRTNVEFIQVLDRHRLTVRFWERGVGPTLSSGTGSSAAAVAAILNGYAESPLRVETELGVLLVNWEPGEELFLTGPAEYIFRGTYGQ